MSGAPQKEKPKWLPLAYIAVAIGVVTAGISAFGSLDTERKSPVDRAMERAAELEASGVELPSDVQTDPTIPTPPETDEIRTLSDIDFASYDRDLARFVGLEIGQSLSEANAALESHFGNSEGGAIEFSTVATDGGTVIVAEQGGLQDDSVKAERVFIVTKKFEDGTETLVDYGMKIKCWRGEDPGKWQTALCP